MKQETIKSERIVYSEVCPICNKKIRGFSESAVKFNMELHKEKHKKEDKE